MSDLTEAYKSMQACPKCKLSPTIAYDPGCHFTECLHGEKCPVRCAVPDWDPKGLAQLVNRRIESHGKKT